MSNIFAQIWYEENFSPNQWSPSPSFNEAVTRLLPSLCWWRQQLWHRAPAEMMSVVWKAECVILFFRKSEYLPLTLYWRTLLLFIKNRTYNKEYLTCIWMQNFHTTVNIWDSLVLLLVSYVISSLNIFETLLSFVKTLHGFTICAFSAAKIKSWNALISG